MDFNIQDFKCISRDDINFLISTLQNHPTKALAAERHYSIKSRLVGKGLPSGNQALLKALIKIHSTMHGVETINRKYYAKEEVFQGLEIVPNTDASNEAGNDVFSCRSHTGRGGQWCYTAPLYHGRKGN